MTDPAPAAPARTAHKRTVLMCRPEHFTVSYRINPWMHPEDPTDTNLAVVQWDVLHKIYLDLGFEVHLIDPIAGLPDMVYAANGGFVIDGIAYAYSGVAFAAKDVNAYGGSAFLNATHSTSDVSGLVTGNIEKKAEIAN